MSTQLRILLIAVSFLTILFVLKKIRRTQLYIDDAIYWIVCSLLLFVISLFPQIAIFAAKILEIESTANLVFLVMIFMVLVKLFNVCIDLSVQRSRLNRLVQKLALMNESERVGRHSADPTDEEEARTKARKTRTGKKS
ncbi:MAG: DUF2304 domain-containing protein [Ruminococcaceae bacterium]|nr:DUF2304 domain-containing protein [Oscillospiraceae bacterium]